MKQHWIDWISLCGNVQVGFMMMIMICSCNYLQQTYQTVICKLSKCGSRKTRAQQGVIPLNYFYDRSSGRNNNETNEILKESCVVCVWWRRRLSSVFVDGVQQSTRLLTEKRLAIDKQVDGKRDDRRNHKNVYYVQLHNNYNNNKITVSLVFLSIFAFS